MKPNLFRRIVRLRTSHRAELNSGLLEHKPFGFASYIQLEKLGNNNCVPLEQIKLNARAPSKFCRYAECLCEDIIYK